MTAGLLPLLVLATLAWGGAADSRQLEEGAVAGANRWTTQGGSVAHTRATLTAPIRGPVELAWRLDVSGEIVGEPLVWGSRVLVEVRASARRRRLLFVDLFDGPPAYLERAFASDVALAPNLWNDVVLLRSGRSELAAFRCAAGDLVPLWSPVTTGALGPPLLFEREVYVAVGGALTRWELGAEQPSWVVQGRFRGLPSLRGDDLYSFDYDRAGNGFLVRLERATGAVRSRTPIGHHGGRAPPASSTGFAAVMDHELLCYPALELEIGRFVSPSVGLERPPPETSVRTIAPITLAHAVPAARWGDAWLALFVDPRRGRTWLRSRPTNVAGGPSTQTGADGSSFAVLARGHSHAELLDRAAPPSVADDVAYFAGCALDLATLEVLWATDLDEVGAAVPALDTVLVRAGERALVALRAAGTGRDVAIDWLPPWDPGAVLRDAGAVLRDGTVVSGELEVRADEDVLVEHGPEGQTRRSLARIALVLDAHGAPVHASGERALLRAGDALIERTLADGYARLAQSARAAGDPDLLRRLLVAARARGAEGAELAEAVAALAAAPAEGAPRDPAVIEAALSSERRVHEAAADVAWDLLAGLPEAAPDRLEHELLRRVLRAVPSHAEAVARVRARLPWEVAADESLDALDWIDFLEAAARYPVRRVEPPAGARSTRSAAQRALAAARADWRPDLQAFETERLVIVSPVDRPGGIARCLVRGERVCAALEELFAAVAPRERHRRRPRRLVLHLFDSRDEYLRVGGGDESGTGLAWSAGHYDPAAEVSRIFLPSDEHAWDSVLRTYAHELAHHWMQLRCPLVSEAEARRAQPDAPGYWVVEGFAALVEEFHFDPGTDTWESLDPRSRRLDDIANAAPDQHLPWRDVLELSQRQFHALETSGSIALESTWFLGVRRRLGGRHLYYNQAAAVCRYLLHAEGGALRPLLLRYLADYYAGRARGLDAERAFGLAPEELGERAVALARELRWK